MEPGIQYATTADGVSIAFWAMGEGAPFVQMPEGHFSHLELEWQIPEYRRWYELLARSRRLVRYDGRGSGLSQRDVEDYSLDARVLDLEAVVARLGLERFALLGAVHGGPVAIAYAVRHPERVSHLILWCAYARGSDFLRAPAVPSLRSLLDKDWELYTETIAHAYLGWSAEQAHRFATYMRECTTPQAAQAAYAAADEFDVTGLLPQVRSPTLVLHRRQLRLLGVEVARSLASQIADARLALLEGEAISLFVENTNEVFRTVSDFLGEREAITLVETAVGGLRTVLFTDVEGSAALTQRLGDAQARDVLREYTRIVREALRAHGGSEVKALGDGFMASFSSATGALECAVEMERAFAAYNESAREPLRVRIGLNAGEPIEEERDLFGTAVIVAERICGIAKGGEILASDVVRQLVAGRGFLFTDRGDVALKGFEEPVRLHEVRWRP